MAPRVAVSFSSSLLLLRPKIPTTILAIRPLSHPPLAWRVSVRTSVTVGTSAEGGAINIQQVPAPGSGYIRVLLLNRPKARNAISKELLNTLRFHVDSIAAEHGNGPTRALVIASNTDSAFCAGADLKERKDMSKEE
jgi:methylglutaconyl-CoA hydratase